MQLKSGTILNNGRYEIKSCIGDGGFGITYIADDKRLDREIVIKEYFPDYMAIRDVTVSNTVRTIDSYRSEELHTGIEKFMKEAKTLARLNEIQAIANVHDFFEENNTAYIVMEYIKGKNLKQYIKERTAPYSFAEAMAILGPCMFALQKVHEAGIIHRDFAPDNIIIDSKGRVKIIDFGSSRDYVSNNATMTVMVKHGYAPLEQYSNAVKQGPYTDVYSLGAILYEMLTLEKPMQSIDRVIADNLRVPSSVNYSVTQVQDAVVMKALAVVYSSRYQTVQELFDALRKSENQNLGVAYTGMKSAYMPNTGVGISQERNNSVSVYACNNAATSNGFEATELLSTAGSGYVDSDTTELLSVTSQQYYQQEVVSPKEKKSKKGLIIGVVCSIVVIGIGIALSGSKATSKTETDDPTTTVEGETEESKWVVSKRTSFSSDGEITGQCKYEYDNKGNCEKETYYDSNSTIHNYYEYEYDNKGQRVKFTICGADESIHVWYEYEYDNKGNQVKQTWYNPDGSVPFFLYEYKYDNKGNLEKETVYKKGVIYYYIEYEYDEMGHLVKKTTCEPDGIIHRWTEYKYDNKGNLEKETEYEKDVIENYDEYEYDDMEHLVKKTTYAPDGIYRWTEYKYDNKGNLKKETEYSADGSIFGWIDYEYVKL